MLEPVTGTEKVYYVDLEGFSKSIVVPEDHMDFYESDIGSIL